MENFCANGRNHLFSAHISSWKTGGGIIGKHTSCDHILSEAVGESRRVGYSSYGALVISILCFGALGNTTVLRLRSVQDTRYKMLHLPLCDWSIEASKVLATEPLVVRFSARTSDISFLYLALLFSSSVLCSTKLRPVHAKIKNKSFFAIDNGVLRNNQNLSNAITFTMLINILTLHRVSKPIDSTLRNH